MDPWESKFIKSDDVTFDDTYEDEAQKLWSERNINYIGKYLFWVEAPIGETRDGDKV